MAYFLQGKKIDNCAEVEISIQEFFDSHGISLGSRNRLADR
ncbi:unnamed protein product [Nezara viridula]|uniref:Uncharacterized protein n=1 Tax=Nezara viridula TaxID=85310 RepID=A0A9P0ED85_NEZVI|nr:unnamed protein product [Nezara viridula]